TEKDVDERVPELRAAPEIDGRIPAETEAPADVDAEHERRDERRPKPDPVAPPKPLRLSALEPARPCIGEDGPLDPGEAQRADEGGPQADRTGDREAPLLVQQHRA